MDYLSAASLPALAARGVQVPTYDRSKTKTSIVHFGPGAFHRVHQASYFDRALQDDARWGICEVALHSSGVRDALQPQDHLYTIAVLDEQSSYRVIGAVTETLVAHESVQAVLNRLIAPDTHFITATITEKGYCLDAGGGLDTSHPDIAHDLAYPEAPKSFVGYVTHALHLRYQRKLPALNVVSCDNLADNGHRLRRAVLDFARQRDPSLARWIEDNVAFPRTMVDSITPATDEALRTRVANALGIQDRWPVQREFFTQWVIEDCLRGPQPRFSDIGVTITNDVAGFEAAKLRLLNGAHSTLAYVGRLAGIETVANAMQDGALPDFIRKLMIEEIAPAVDAPAGLDASGYIDTILRRFRNPEIRHLLSQIAWDGSQKIPFRLLGTIEDNLQAGRPIQYLCVTLAAWFHFIRRQHVAAAKLVDPLADVLYAVAARCNGDAAHDVSLFLKVSQVFPNNLAHDSAVRSATERAYARLAGVNSARDLTHALN